MRRQTCLKVGIRSDLNEFPVLPSTRPQPLCKLLPMQALGVHDVNRPGAAGVKRKPAVDYTSVKRQSPPSVFYIRAAHARIVNDFPMFYKTDIRNFLARNGNYYAPTYLKLYDAAVRNHLPPGVRKMAKKRSANQGPEPVSNDVEFDNEYEWVHAVWKVGYNRTRADRKIRNSLAPATPAKNQSVHIAEKSFKIECGCCFNDECSFVDMIQCIDGHLFCRDCVNAQAGTAVGVRKPDILCMDGTGCKQSFPKSELQKCLDHRTFALWQKIIQAQEIAAAELEGLEQCPACDFAMIFEVGYDTAPLLTCLNSDCRLVTCRRCRKKAHTGRPCQNEEDAKLKAEHAVEEAMTKALLRACPGCRIPFVKSNGCNKIICLNVQCRMISCYLCRQPLPSVNPYDHFDRNRHGANGKCKLWDLDGNGDDPRQRHAAEVAEAERRAREQYPVQGQNI